MAASAWTLFNSAKLGLVNGTIDLDSDSFKMALMTSSFTPDVASQSAWTGISANEIAGANGYTTGGAALNDISLTESSGTVTWDNTADPSWTANGGNIAARYAVIYDSTTGDLICYCLLDTTPADVTVTDGNTLTIQLAATGIFQLS